MESCQVIIIIIIYIRKNMCFYSKILLEAYLYHIYNTFLASQYVYWGDPKWA